MSARHLLIHGCVQGVGYRDWAATAARAIGIEGWVRNRRDGSVEALVAGSPERIAAFIDAARRGPIAARVERIDEGDAEAPPLNGFAILPSL